MDEFLLAELEADPTRAARHGEKPAEESHQKRSQGVAKRTRPQSIEPCSKKIRRESVAEVPSKATSSSTIDLEPIHAGSEGVEGSEVPLLLRSHRFKGSVVVTAEALPGGVTGR